MGAGSALQAQQPVTLLTPEGVEQRKGVLAECSQLKGIAFFPRDGALPVYGWLLRYEPDANTLPAPEASPGAEKTSPAEIFSLALCGRRT